MRAQVLMALVAAAALAGCRRSPEAAVAVVITEPANEATVSSPVRVVLRVRGIEIAPAAEQRPGTAHHHLFLDRDPTPMADTIPAGVTGIIHLGRGQTEFVFDSLAPGSHRVIAVLADPGHFPIGGAAPDTVRFTIP